MPRVMDSKGGKQTLPFLPTRYLYDKKKRQNLDCNIATRQWFYKLFTSEADAFVDDFGNNPPPEIGTQSYSGYIHDKRD